MQHISFFLSLFKSHTTSPRKSVSQETAGNRYSFLAKTEDEAFRWKEALLQVFIYLLLGLYQG